MLLTGFFILSCSASFVIEYRTFTGPRASSPIDVRQFFATYVSGAMDTSLYMGERVNMGWWTYEGEIGK